VATLGVRGSPAPENTPSVGTFLTDTGSINIAVGGNSLVSQL
jgi:hypothetical protein